MSVEIRDLDGKIIFVYPGDTLAGAELKGERLLRVDLRHRDLRGINLERAFCREADFSYSDMSGEMTSLVYAQCHDAKFIGTNLFRANCERINICGADLTDADAREIRSLGWKWDERTKFPKLM